MRKLLTIALVLFILVCSGYLLIAGKDLLIPLVIAIVIWYLIIALSNALRCTPFIGAYLPYPVALGGAFAIALGAIWFIFDLVVMNVSLLISSLPLYQERLNKIAAPILSTLGADHAFDLSSTIKQFNMVPILTNIAQVLTTLAGSAGIIIIYVVFLILEYRSFDKKMAIMMKDREKLASTREIIQKISTQIQSYILIKTFISFLTAGASYLVLIGVGIDFATFWALLIFLLHYIPTIGAVVAIIFPCLLAFIQFDSLYPFIIVSSLLIAIEFIMGNILEPKMMGKSFNLSGLMILLSLALWGSIWGITGMFLCVPIMVIANIILSNFHQTRPIAIFLSEKGYPSHSPE